MREGRLPERDAASFERHLEGCEACRTRHAEDERLGRLMLASDARIDIPDLRVHRVWARILKAAAVPAPVRRWSRVGVLAAAAAIVLVGGVALARVIARDAGPTMAGEIRPDPGAIFEQAREGRVERVTVEEGTIHVHVRKQQPGERFLVELPDGELEVRGTTFEVGVHGGATDHVRVSEGVVAVRMRGHDELERRAGESWPPAVAAAHEQAAMPVEGTPAIPVSALPVAVGAPHKAAGASETETAEYVAAMGLYRDGEKPRAAEAFHRFAVAHPTSPLLEDATYLEAVSLAAAGDEAGAGEAASRHLARFPSSFHRKEASILVARAARDRGDCAAATRALAPWAAESGEGKTGEVARALQGCEVAP